MIGSLTVVSESGNEFEFVQLVCAVEQRHPVTHEPLTLRVIQPSEEVDLEIDNDFIVPLFLRDCFYLTSLEIDRHDDASGEDRVEGD